MPAALLRPLPLNPHPSFFSNWIITAPIGYIIALNFSSFSTEASADIVTVYNGGNTTSPVLAQLSGAVLPGPVVSTVQSMYVAFTSNSAVTSLGFTAAANFLVAPCRGSTAITTNNTMITDGDGLYVSNMNCSWAITAPSDARVALSFSQFATEVNADFVVVYDASGADLVLLGNFSGTNVPSTLRTVGARMLVLWSSNPANNLDGFVATVTFEGFPLCANGSATAITRSGTVISDGSGNYPVNWVCLWNITAPPLFTIGLTFQAFSTSNDVLRVYDAPSPLTPALIASPTGAVLPSALRSTTNSVFLSFVSDAASVSTGFAVTVTFYPFYCNGTTLVSTSGLTIVSSAVNYLDNQNW